MTDGVSSCDDKPSGGAGEPVPSAPSRSRTGVEWAIEYQSRVDTAGAVSDQCERRCHCSRCVGRGVCALTAHLPQLPHGSSATVEVGHKEFARYRTFHSLPPTPAVLEITPVILSIAGHVEHCLTPIAVDLIAKDVFTQ